MEGSLQRITLTEIGDTIGTPPSERLVESVKRMGVLQPVILTRTADDAGEIRLQVVDGNRRIAAARAAEVDSIPAVVFDALEPNTIAETTLATNSFRSSNYLAEFWALKHLERNHYEYQDLVAASGMAWSTIKHRRLLSNLNRELFVALRNGQINQGIALSAAKLPAHQQQELASRFSRFGKLARKDIQAVSPPASATSESGDKIADQLTQAASAAAELGYNKAEFLEMAERMWDQIHDHTAISQNTTGERFPDLAAHKWDTGEG